MSAAENKTILVAVDFSENARDALVFGAQLAQDLGAPLVIMHAVHDPGESPGLYSEKQTRKRLRKMEEIAGEMLGDFIQKARKDHPTLKALKKPDTRLVVGLPVTRILELSDKIQPRMVVMGSQGRTGLERALIGSKAEQVTRLSRVPVTIVHQPKS